MPLKQPKVIKDILNIKGGGVYCYLPFEKLDDEGNAVFKIGMAIDFTQRTGAYHSYFPLGVYLVAFLINPEMKVTRFDTVKSSKTSFYKKIEKQVIDYIIKNGGQRIYTSTRVLQPNEDNYGSSEWIYANETVIHEAFIKAQEEHGGRTELYYLDNNINTIARANKRKKPNYVAEIVYPLKKI